MADEYGLTEEERAEYKQCVEEMKNGNTTTAKKILENNFLKLSLCNDPCVQLWGDGDIELDKMYNEGYSLWATFAIDKKWFEDHIVYW